MLKTKRLYYTDCYLRDFEARVLDVISGPSGVHVYLDQTAFYPDSGGQPSDRGTLGGLPLNDCLDERDTIAHVVNRKPEGSVLKGEIDWVRRFDHMQQHTGQHILSAAFERIGKYGTVSFHLGAETSTIDLESERLGSRQIEDTEELANQVVFEDRPVRFFFRGAEEAGGLDLRKPSPREGEVRLVEVEDLDLSACGGTHVSRTGAVGMVLVRKVERMKSQTRVEFVCGGRALKAVRADLRVLTEAARYFSAAHDKVPELIAKQAEELRVAGRGRETLLERLAEYQARELREAAPERRGWKIVRRIFPAEEAAEAKKVAHAIARQPSSIALIGVKGKAATVIFAQSAGGPWDMGSTLKQTLARWNGKGGGTREFAQGGGLGEGQLEPVLAFADSLVL